MTRTKLEVGDAEVSSLQQEHWASPPALWPAGRQPPRTTATLNVGEPNEPMSESHNGR